MRTGLIIVAGFCFLAVLGIVIAWGGTNAVPTRVLLWVLPFAAGGALMVWLARRAQ